MNFSTENAGTAFLALSQAVMQQGHIIQSRQGLKVRELTGVTVQINKPLQRVICLPERHNNIFATVFETLWVLGGRNDIESLSFYLPRAGDYSDDGKTWRGGYGPRLRNWQGVDQVERVIELLKEDPDSRRAVISLFDPATDFENSLDIPCNNWLQFLIRDNKLIMHVAQRSCDVLWGFSGINTFEWSVLQETISNILGVEMGHVTWFIGSAHLYENTWDRVNKMLSHIGRLFQEMYPLGIRPVQMALIRPHLENLDAQLDSFFSMESDIRIHKYDWEDVIRDIVNPFIRNALWMMLIYNNIKDVDFVSNIVNREMDDSDLKTAVIEYLTRTNNVNIYKIRHGVDSLFLNQFPDLK